MLCLPTEFAPVDFPKGYVYELWKRPTFIQYACGIVGPYMTYSDNHSDKM